MFTPETNRLQRRRVEGAELALPVAAHGVNQTALGIVAAGQVEQALAVQHLVQIGYRLAHQRRLFLSVFREKTTRRNAAQQGF